jgi:putative ABC transport system permease protein
MKTPPKLLLRLMEALCPHNRPDLKGDFLELYEYREETLGRFEANRKFLVDCLSVIPLNFIIPQELKSSNAILMFNTNLKIARRNLAKNKMYTAINLLGLTIGLTACILITLFVRDEISFDKHFKDSERIFRIAANYNQGAEGIVASAVTSYLIQPLIEGNSPGVDHMCRINFQSELITLENDKQYLESEILFADSTFFDIFSLRFLRGDPATALDKPESVVLDNETAEKYFGEADPIGKFIQLKDKQFAVTGVIDRFPANSHFTCRIVFPTSGIEEFYPDWVLKNITGRNSYTYIKTQEKFDPQEFARHVNKVVGEVWRDDGTPKFFVQPVSEIHLESNLEGEIRPNGSKTDVYIFSAIALVILVLACINYVNLSMAGSLQRSKEIGMKKALGSTSRMQLAQFQTESLLVVTTGGVLAMILCTVSMPLFNSLTGKTLTFILGGDPFIVTALAVVTIFIGLIAGGFPALTLLRFGTIGLLSGKLQFKNRKSYFRNSLILFQFAISITLIASTLIVMDQINFIRNKELGVDTEHLVMIPFQTDEISQKYEVFRNELLKKPSVLGVSASTNKVTSRVLGWRPYVVDGAKEDITIPTVDVSHEFFENMGAKILDGRSFSRDHKTDFMTAYILNEAAVKSLGLKDPVGKPLLGYAFTGSVWTEKKATIIGVVNDFHFASLHSNVEPVVFSLASEITSPLSWMQVRIKGENIRNTIESLKGTWTTLAPDRPFQFEFMDDALRQNYYAEERFLRVFIAFSVLSILLGCLGLFGLTAFMTKRRTKEIGIRKILGASTGRLIGVLSSDFLKLVIVANIIGWPVAYYLMNNWLQNFAYQTRISLWIFFGTGVAALIVAFVAVLYHSLNASLANPVKALRYE